MKILREKLPSGSALKALQNYEVYGDKLGKHVLLLQLSDDNFISIFFCFK